MSESFNDRLQRKIDASKARAEREKQQGGLRKDPGGWSYDPGPLPPNGQAVPNAPTQAPTQPAQPTKPKDSAAYRAQLWFQTKAWKPHKTDAYPVAFQDPIMPQTVIYYGSTARYWDGCSWHTTPDPSSVLLGSQDAVWWTYP